jgi:tRNA threonylcarbamoyladenosine dehydratase
MTPNCQVKWFRHYDTPELQALRKSKAVVFETDLFDHALDELFEIEFPWLKPGNAVFNRTKQQWLEGWKAIGPFKNQGQWAYYPWSKQLVHFPPEEVFKRLRTARNRNLITEEEQVTFQNKCVGIAGMSVGSNILNSLVLVGGPRHLKISDPDTISIPNLNRLMAPASAVGLNKAVYFGRRTVEVDPFIKVDVYDKGLTPSDFESFFNQPKLDLFIEEMDDPYLKVESRKMARKLRIPVLQAADNGDGALIDVERFDLEPDRPLFHGRFEGVMDLNSISEKLTFAQKLTMIANIVHLEEATPRAQSSLQEVGSVLNTWPQLGTAALTCGIALTYIARRILLGEPMPSGRYHLTWEESLVPGYNASTKKQARQQHTQRIMHNFNSFQAFIHKVMR